MPSDPVTDQVDVAPDATDRVVHALNRMSPNSLALLGVSRFSLKVPLSLQRANRLLAINNFARPLIPMCFQNTQDVQKERFFNMH